MPNKTNEDRSTHRRNRNIRKRSNAEQSRIRVDGPQQTT